jgi:hypothetical protein
MDHRRVQGYVASLILSLTASALGNLRYNQ